MIIWLASYPRSGNTLFRIVLNVVYQLPTYTGFMSDDDLEVDGVKENITGHAKLPDKLLTLLQHKSAFFNDGSAESKRLREVLHEMEGEETIYVIKTHSANQEIVETPYRTILLIRDGRDAVLSMVWYVMNVHHTVQRVWQQFSADEIIKRPGSWLPFGSLLLNRLLFQFQRKLRGEKALFRRLLNDFFAPNDRWSKLNNSWVNRPQGNTVVVYFDDLVKSPIETVQQALAQLGIEQQSNGKPMPSFEELKKLHPHFFRQGVSGRWKNEFPPEQLAAFERINSEALRKFGFIDSVANV